MCKGCIKSLILGGLKGSGIGGCGNVRGCCGIKIMLGVDWAYGFLVM